MNRRLNSPTLRLPLSTRKNRAAPIRSRNWPGPGIAYKLAVALSGQAEPEWQVLAAIGTIADLVPLTDENRILAKCGLEAIKRADLPGVRSLIHVSGSRVEIVRK